MTLIFFVCYEIEIYILSKYKMLQAFFTLLGSIKYFSIIILSFVASTPSPVLPLCDCSLRLAVNAVFAVPGGRHGPTQIPRPGTGVWPADTAWGNYFLKWELLCCFVFVTVIIWQQTLA